MVLHEWLAFYSAFLNIHRSGVHTALAWLVPHETAAVSAQVLCTPYNHASCHFMHSHIRKVYACLTVTCHLHFWQNDRDLLRATAVTRGWNGYQNKSQHRQSTMEKEILPPLQQGFEHATFQSRVRRSNHWAIPAPVNLRSKDVTQLQQQRPESLTVTLTWHKCKYKVHTLDQSYILTGNSRLVSV